MKSFSDLIDDLGGAAAVARFSGLKPGTVQQMKSRDSVQPRYWPFLIAMARQARVIGVTHDALIQLASRPPKQAGPLSARARRRRSDARDAA